MPNYKLVIIENESGLDQIHEIGNVKHDHVDCYGGENTSYDTTNSSQFGDHIYGAVVGI